MKEIGEKLKEARDSIGVSIDEVAEDLKFQPSQIENIESGNIEAFSDVFSLKYFIRDYAKYLGLDKEELVDEFNEYLFDYTSKLSLEDIKKESRNRKEDSNKIKSPYTVELKSEKRFQYITYIVIAILLFVICYILLQLVQKRIIFQIILFMEVFMNLPNKITMIRIILTVLIVGILIFPFDAVGLASIKLFINEAIVVDLKYLIAGGLFIIAALTDFIDGYIARKYNLITDLGKMLDAIADKFLVNSVLIVLSAQGLVHPIIPVIVVTRDTVVDIIKMIVGSKKGAVAAIKSGKWKTTFLLVGIILILFNNLPFELINIKVSDVFLIIGTVLAIYSGIQYYQMNKKVILG